MPTTAQALPFQMLCALTVSCAVSASPMAAVGAADASLVILAPQPYRVHQRMRYDVRASHVHAATSAALGGAEVNVRFQSSATSAPETVVEARTSLLPGGKGSAVDWTSLAVQATGEERWGRLYVPSGGWYRLELRLRHGHAIIAQAAVEPIGVGEVFLIAGQSYAAGANDELLKLNDTTARAAAWDAPSNAWRVAHDPQPNVGEGGTIWPAMVDELLPLWQVPIGLVNVSVGATSARQWLPDGELFARLMKAGNQVAAFRAVLWQQGESDVIEKTTADEYVERLQTIRAAAAAHWKAEPQWLLAKSTLHPTVYNDPSGEGRIRAAIDRLWQSPGFRRGPDTDLLDGENRGDTNSHRHFTALGQRRAGRLWAGSILAHIDSLPPAVCDGVDWRELRTTDGLHYATLGPPPTATGKAAPAPTLLVLALGLEQMRTNPIYSRLAQEMAEAGWLCITIDPPCHGEDHRSDEPEGLAGWRRRLERREPLMDDFARRARAVLDDAVQRGWCDPARIAASGTSRGGFCALHLARTDRRIRAVVGFAPVTDLAPLDEFIEIQVSPDLQALAMSNYADALADRRIWITIGNRDERVDTARAVQFCDAVVEAAARRGIAPAAAVELSVTASPGHSTPPDAHRRAAEWLKREFGRP